MEDATFRTNDINKARLLWDPSVHELYGEQCRFLLMRFHDPEVSSLVPQLQQLMDKALIESYNIYLVYGYYDVFIRVWSTPQKWTRLIELVELSFAPRLASQQPYHIDRLDYLWAPRHSNRTPRPEVYRKRIDEVSLKEREGDLRNDDADVAELLKLGIVHHLNEEPGGSIKFYVLLSKFSFRFPTPTDYDELRRILIEGSLPFVRKPSIYRIAGGGEYFLKFVVGRYDEVLPVISVLTLATRQFNLRTMTLLISNSTAPETDVIHPNWEDFPASLFQLEGILRESASSIGLSLARLDIQNRLDVARMFDRHRSLMNEHMFQPMFEGFFLARAEQDIQMLSEKLNWIIHLEALFRAFFLRLAKDELRNNWLRTVQGAAKDVGLSEQQRPESYGLRETLDVLSKLVAEGKLPSVEVERRLGSDWADRIRGLTETFAKTEDFAGLQIRNNLAHGTLYEQPDQYWLNWIDVAERVFSAAVVYIQLRREQNLGQR